MYDLIIIGAGPSGIYGTYYASYNGFKVLLLEIDEIIGGKPLKLFPEKPIYDFPGLLDITGKKLIGNLLSQLNRVDKEKYDIKTKIDITSIQKVNNNFILTDSNNNTYQSKYVILATGYTSFRNKTVDPLKLKTKNKINFYLEDLTKYSNQKIVILGGGDTAIDYANLLSNYASEITLVHRSEFFKAHDSSLNSLFTNEKIKTFANYKVNYIDDYKVFIRAINDDKNAAIDYDQIFVCYGVELVESNLSKANILNDSFKLEVDENFESKKIKNIFGAGNIVNKKTKDLIIFSIVDITKIIQEIMSREKMKYK